MSHVYVCLLSNGLIKIGRSTTPERRLRQHSERVSCLGVSIVSSETYKCANNSFFSEADLLERCKKSATEVFNREWFSGLEYKEVCKWAEDAANKELTFSDGVLIGEKVKDLLISGFTQKDLADAVGIAQSTISDLSTGKQKDIGIDGGGRLLEHLHKIHCTKAA